MKGAPNEAAVLQVIGAAYDSALDQDCWPLLLEKLARLFHSGFADVFARSDDRTRWKGVAYGLDHDDYQNVFLGTWVRRNVWSALRPVRHAGEIVTTNDIMPAAELRRSEMYADYLAPRGLHEGLRLSLFAGSESVHYISILRPWSAGPFAGADLDLAHILLPHLQRAAAITRRLRDTDSLEAAGMAALDSLHHAAFVLDGRGRLLRANRQAEALARGGEGLVLRAGGLSAVDPAVSAALDGLLARALGHAPPWAGPGELHIPRPNATPLTVTATKLPAEGTWSALHGEAVLVLAVASPPSRSPSRAVLAGRFGLTGAEADLAVSLAAGRSLADIAAQGGRSLNTLRTHLRQLMAKTGTSRQSAVVHALLSHQNRDDPAEST